jgi:signal transduction histidine kinase
VTLTWSGLAWSLLWSAIAGLAVWFGLFFLRRRSFAGLLVSLVCTGAAASAGALLGAIHSMLVPGGWDWQTLVALTAFSAAVTAVAAIAVGVRVARETSSLRHAVAEIGAGRIPAAADGRRLTAEIDRVRTELRDTAAALAATRERERALESARRDLVSWVSHDLRTPLAGLRAMAEALEDGVADDVDGYYKQIVLSVDRLNRMVEDLFDLSRIQAGAASRDVEQLALGDLVSDCLVALEPLATAQRVRLSGSLDSETSVVGNGTELNRALTNLIANALRHTPPEGSVAVRVGTVDPDHAEVSIEDECGGIPIEILDRVFEVGFRGEAARTPHNGTVGAGLGLAITRGIIEAHDGTVDVVNFGDGCRFRVRLPTTTAAPRALRPAVADGDATVRRPRLRRPDS